MTRALKSHPGHPIPVDLSASALNPLMVQMSSITVEVTLRGSWAAVMLAGAGRTRLPPANWLAGLLESALEEYANAHPEVAA